MLGCSTVRPELVEGFLMLRQAQHERFGSSSMMKHGKVKLYCIEKLVPMELETISPGFALFRRERDPKLCLKLQKPLSLSTMP